MKKLTLTQMEGAKLSIVQMAKLFGGTDDKKKKVKKKEADSEPAVEEIEIAIESFTMEML